MTARVLGALFAVAVIAFPGAASRAAEYRIDPAHSVVQFKISHLGFSWMVGVFDRISGSFTFDPAAGPAGQNVSVEIETASIDTGHAERDKHLRSRGFLNVRKFPNANFVSTGYEGGAEAGTMKGNLTLMGVTRPIAIAVKKVGEGDDPWGGYRAGFEGTVTLNRRDFAAGRRLGPASETMEFFLSIEGIRN
ncbi:MAG: YceI family protein [Defluviicoccus sp.]|nr:YceI family protein [Defluviicoccus sp.]MDE0385519.1 YceI family protein [Defluviicoccus sp.]